MSDFDYDYDLACPKCGHSPIHSRDCSNLHCEEGLCDEYDDDPINFAPGEEISACPDCRGTGVERWCPKCGTNLSGMRVIDLEDDEQSSLADGVKLLLSKIYLKLPEQEFNFTLAEANDLRTWTNAEFFIKNDLVEYRLLSGETTKKDDTADFSKTEITGLIAKVHESMEGRYDLSGEDLFNIHSALCKLQ